MIKQCENCPRTFESSQDQPKQFGFEQTIYSNFARYRKHFDLCDNCLIEKIRADTKDSPTPQD